MRTMMQSLLCAGLLATAVAGETPRPPFADLGPQVGDFLPELPLTDLEGNAVSSSELAHGLFLLVTGSYTCPKTRSSFPGLKLLAKRYEKKLTVAVVYVIEAHPVIDP